MTKDQFISDALIEHENRFGLLDDARCGCIIQAIEASYYLGQSHVVIEIADTLSPFVAEMVAPKGPRPTVPNPQEWNDIVRKNQEESDLADLWRGDRKRNTIRRI